MPAGSRHIDEEGVLIDNFFLVHGGEFQLDTVQSYLRFVRKNAAGSVCGLLGSFRYGEFAVEASILSNHRCVAPFGVGGGYGEAVTGELHSIDGNDKAIPP